MPRLIFSPSARQDLTEIFDFIARDKPAAASNWIDMIEEKCKLMAETPEFGEKRPEYGANIRSSVVGRYVIFYRSIDSGIEVVRIISGDRDIRLL
ncbi:MAG: type II toxin-antitoxin system RelE/ParE family toxin [Pirellula sp.]